MKDTIRLLGITLGNRKSGRKKLLFINTIAQTFLDQGLKAQVQQKSAFGNKCTNLLVGDMEQKTIVLAGYDTPSSALFMKAPYYPLDASKNLKIETKNTLHHFLLVLPALFCAFYWIQYGHVETLGLQILRILTLLAGLILAGIGILMPGDAINYNRNSIGTALLYELAQSSLPIGCVFLDSVASSYRGYKQIVNYFDAAMKHKTCLILDGLADGEQLIVACRKNMEEKARILAGIVHAEVVVTEDGNSMLDLFDHALLLCRCDVENGTYVIQNCRNKKDYMIKVEETERLLEDLKTALKNGL